MLVKRICYLNRNLHFIDVYEILADTTLNFVEPSRPKMLVLTYLLINNFIKFFKLAALTDQRIRAPVVSDAFNSLYRNFKSLLKILK